MKFQNFLEAFRYFLAASPSVELRHDTRIVFLSDLHLGDGGSGDDLVPNRDLAIAALRNWYLERGYTLILGGDIEDVQKFPLGKIREAWGDLFGLFDDFASRGKLFKLVGNHDLALFREKNYPYQLADGLRLDWKGRSLFCFHGHQASKFFVKYGFLGGFIVKHLAKPLKVKNASVSTDSRQRFKAERLIYRASKKLGIVSICGHTHRPLFESHSKYDSLRWTIEELLREYTAANAERRVRIADLVRLYRVECERLGKKEQRWALSRSLYEERALLIPCIFNSGCATGKHGITAIEVEDGTINLVHWAREGHARAYLKEEAVSVDGIDETDIARYTLKRTGLDHVFARIDLLGS